MMPLYGQIRKNNIEIYGVKLATQIPIFLVAHRARFREPLQLYGLSTDVGFITPILCHPRLEEQGWTAETGRQKKMKINIRPKITTIMRHI